MESCSSEVLILRMLDVLERMEKTYLLEVEEAVVSSEMEDSTATITAETIVAVPDADHHLDAVPDAQLHPVVAPDAQLHPVAVPDAQLHPVAVPCVQIDIDVKPLRRGTTVTTGCSFNKPAPGYTVVAPPQIHPNAIRRRLPPRPHPPRRRLQRARHQAHQRRAAGGTYQGRLRHLRQPQGCLRAAEYTPMDGLRPRSLPSQPPPDSPRLLWPPGPGPGGVRPNARGSASSVTRMGCDGMVLCTAINHCLCDGIGIAQYLHAWVCATRTGHDDAGEIQTPFHDCHALRPRCPPRVSFTAPRCNVLAVKSPSGTGILSGRGTGTEIPKPGMVTINGRAVTSRAQWRRMGWFVTRDDNLLPLLNVRAAWFRLRAAAFERERRRHVRALKLELAPSEVADSYIDGGDRCGVSVSCWVSGGERKQFSIAMDIVLCKLERVHIYYHEASCGRFVPRSVLRDLEPGATDVVLRRSCSIATTDEHAFHPLPLCSGNKMGQSDCRPVYVVQPHYGLNGYDAFVTIQDDVTGHLLIAFSVSGSLYMASMLIGSCFGAAQPLIPVTVSELFGLKYYSVLMDLEPDNIDAVRAWSYSQIFCPDSFVFGQFGADNNLAEGHYIDSILVVIRKKAENCDSVQCFQVCYLLAGGIRSGMGMLLDYQVAEPMLRPMSCCNKISVEYTPAHGVRVCAHTFTIGELNLFNAITVACSENLPIICIGDVHNSNYGTNLVISISSTERQLAAHTSCSMLYLNDSSYVKALGISFGDQRLYVGVHKAVDLDAVKNDRWVSQGPARTVRQELLAALSLVNYFATKLKTWSDIGLKKLKLLLARFLPECCLIEFYYQSSCLRRCLLLGWLVGATACGLHLNKKVHAGDGGNQQAAVQSCHQVLGLLSNPHG